MFFIHPLFDETILLNSGDCIGGGKEAREGADILCIDRGKGAVIEDGRRMIERKERDA